MNQCGDSIRVVHPLFPTEGDGSIPISPLHLEIAEVDMRQAQRLNSLWHSVLPETHLGNLVGNRANVAYAAFYENRFYAVAIWTTPIAANRLKNGAAMLELRRFAIASDAPKNTASRMLSIMVRMIKKKFDFITDLISYQARDHHHGTIYKASNWTATAESKSQQWHATENRATMQTVSDKVRWQFTLKESVNG